MQIARRQKHMNPRPVGKLQRAGGHFDVFFFGPRQRRNPRLANRLRDRRDGRKVTL